MEWTVRLVKPGDKGPITQNETVYPSRGKAAQVVRAYKRNVIRNQEKFLYVVQVDK